MFADNTDINTKSYCIQNGAEAFIEKPINVDYLKIRIKNILEKRKLLQLFLANTRSLLYQNLLITMLTIVS